MSKINFLRCWVVTQQHTSLDVVEAYLKKQHLSVEIQFRFVSTELCKP